ncbi:MAG: hypothetical protein K0S24_1546 [Sphingobacterium sp.]|nr:hypothetical protein [Sphingobacterium sp.]
MYNVSLKCKWDAEAVRQHQEQALDFARQEGLAQGITAKSIEVVENLLSKLELSDGEIADLAKVSVEFVKKIRAGRRKNSK